MEDSDELLATIRRELFTAVVGDVMDVAGRRCQFLPPGIRPLDPDLVLLGRAMPVLQEDRSIETGHAPERPFGLMMDALDSLRPGEIYICTGASASYALWGGLMTTRAMRRDAAGAVLDGFCRDSRELAALRLSGVLRRPVCAGSGRTRAGCGLPLSDPVR